MKLNLSSLWRSTAYAAVAFVAFSAVALGPALLAHADTGNGPTLSYVSVAPSNNSATITWDTSAIGNSQVEYGVSSAYSASTTLDSSLNTTHSVTLTGLNPDTVYHFAVMSSDPSGNTTTSSDQTFTTTGTGATAVAMTPATVMLGASGGAAGSSTSVSGSGFSPNESVNLSFNGSSLGTVTADANGNISNTIAIPSGLGNGTFAVDATGASSGRIAAATFAIGGTSTVTGTVTTATTPTDALTLQNEITSLQSQVNALEVRLANLEAQGGSNVSVSASSTGIPSGDTLYTGTLSNASGGSFTLTTAGGTTYTVNVTSGATIWNNARSTVGLSSFNSGDAIRIDASPASDGSLTADVVRDTSI